MFAVKTKKVVFRRGSKEIIGILHEPKVAPSEVIVITCHGLLSTKDSEKYIELANALTKMKMSVLRFDFSGCGESPGDFRKSTMSSRVEDLKIVLEHIKGSYDRIGLMGSSLGGSISVVVAAEEPSIKAVASWAAPADLGEISKFAEQFLGREFAEDLRGYDVISCAEKVRGLLVIHGDKDEVVPVSHAHKLYNAAPAPKALRIISGADHRFTDPTLRRHAVNESVKWFVDLLL
ncbi:MAG: alpha/beta hydrolase [Candidatus Baldrarchaeia archaeon]